MNIHRFYKVEPEPIKTGKKYWNKLKVKIYKNVSNPNDLFEHWEYIGEYERNYDNFYDTFFPFEKNGKHYALISDSYVRTAVLSLDTCEIVAKETAHCYGFCPVGFYVPRYFDWWYKKGTEEEEYCPIHEGYGLWNHEDLKKNDGLEDEDIKYADFGFVSGCVWGDDHSWKLQWLDLSDVENGVIRREAKFGYLELPHNQKIWDAIDCEFYDENMITINTMKSFRRAEGEQFIDTHEDWMKRQEEIEQSGRPLRNVIKRIMN